MNLEERNILLHVNRGPAALLYGKSQLTRSIDVSLIAGPERRPEIQGLAATSAILHGRYRLNRLRGSWKTRSSFLV